MKALDFTKETDELENKLIKLGFHFDTPVVETTGLSRSFGGLGHFYSTASICCRSSSISLERMVRNSRYSSSSTAISMDSPSK